ncbi:unnamed protein product, partial [Cyprideis torosa]
MELSAQSIAAAQAGMSERPNREVLLHFEQQEKAIHVISELPNDLAKIMDEMSPKDLLKTYREGGWN